MAGLYMYEQNWRHKEFSVLSFLQKVFWETELYNYLLGLAYLTKLLNVNQSNGFLFLATQIS